MKHLLNVDETLLQTVETQNATLENATTQNAEPQRNVFVQNATHTTLQRATKTETITETIVETPIETGPKTDKTEQILRGVKIGSFGVAMILISGFDVALVNGFFDEIGEKIKFQAIADYSILGAIGFVFANLVVSVFGLIDEFQDADYTPAVVFAFLNIAMNCISLLNGLEWSNKWFYAGIIGAFSTPLAMYWLANKLYIIVFKT